MLLVTSSESTPWRPSTGFFSRQGSMGPEKYTPYWLMLRVHHGTNWYHGNWSPEKGLLGSGAPGKTMVKHIHIITGTALPSTVTELSLKGRFQPFQTPTGLSNLLGICRGVPLVTRAEDFTAIQIPKCAWIHHRHVKKQISRLSDAGKP